MIPRLLLSLSLAAMVGCSFMKSSTDPSGGKSGTENAAPTAIPKTLAGTIGEYPIRMTLAQDGAKVNGSYEYTRVGKAIKLSGTVSGKAVQLAETDEKGNPGGTFALNVEGEKLTGEWTSPKGKKLPLALSAASASAQSSPGAVEVKESVVKLQRGKQGQEYPDYKTAEIHFPLVSGLPDAVVMARVQEAVSLKKVFGQTPEEFRKQFQEEWTLDSIEYQINFNRDEILSLTYTQCGTGAYPSCGDEYINVFLRDGFAITPQKAFNDLPGLAKLADGALRAEIRKALADAKNDKEIGDEGYGFLENELNGDESKHKKPYPVEQLKSFIVGEKGVTFIYNYGFPHVAQALEPPGRFFLSWEKLKPFIKADGPFGKFAK